MLSTKINVFGVFKDHYETFIDSKKGIPRISDIITFVGLPLFMGAISWQQDWKFTNEITNIFITVFSIFAGFLINLLVLFFSISQSAKTSFETMKQKYSEVIQNQIIIMDQTLSNISFALIQSIIIVIVLLTNVLFSTDSPKILYISSISLILSANFILNLLMIIKRIYIVISVRS